MCPNAPFSSAPCSSKARLSPPHTARVPPILQLPACMGQEILTRKRGLDAVMPSHIFPLQRSSQIKQKGHSLLPASVQTRQQFGLLWWAGPFMLRKEGGKACFAEGGTCCTWLDTLLGMSWAGKCLLSILYFVPVCWRPPDMFHLQTVHAGRLN